MSDKRGVCFSWEESGVIRITAGKVSHSYRVKAIIHAEEVLGYRLTRPGRGREEAVVKYDVCVIEGHEGCSCGDQTFRQRVCKHMEAVQELLPC